MLNRMLSEVEDMDSNLESSTKCVNTLELQPSNDALIEVPIKKSIKIPKKYKTNHEILIEEPCNYELICFNNSITTPEDPHEYDLISFEDPVPVDNLTAIEESISHLLSDMENEEASLLLGNDSYDAVETQSAHPVYALDKVVHRASSESLSEVTDVSSDSWDDEDDHLNPYEPIQAISYKTYNSDVWWEGTYRNLSIVPEEDEECSSLLGHADTDINYENLKQRKPSVSSDASGSSDSSSHEKIVKAEVKLLVKTMDCGKEEIEVHSVREFLDKGNSKKSDTIFIDYNKDKSSKPVYTLQRLFVRSPNSDKAELVAAPESTFPLVCDSSQQSTSYYSDDSAEYYKPAPKPVPFYPTPAPQSTNPFYEVVKFPSKYKPPKAYCDWVPQMNSSDRGKVIKRAVFN